MMTLEEFFEIDEKLVIFLTKEQRNKIHELVFNRYDRFLIKRNNIIVPYMLVNKKTYWYNINIDLTCKKIEFDKSITFRYIKEFDELFLCKVNDNHEKDVFDYNMVKGLIHAPIIKPIPKIITIAKMKKIRCMLIINKNKKYVIYKKNNEEYRVDCHNDDQFDWQIGFGLALSKCFGKQYKWQSARENFRHNIINEEDGKVKRVLDYESYSKWCIYEYYHNDTDEIKNLQNKVKEINELGKVDL